MASPPGLGRTTLYARARTAPRRPNLLASLLLRPAILLPSTQSRPHATKPQPHPPTLAPVPAASNSLLATQRLHRPVAPFLVAHKWHITSVLSISTRLTGLLLSGMFYAFGAAYAVAPYLGLGWDLSSAGIVTVVSGWSGMVKGVVKMSLAFPFVFHVFNGTRMLLFDATVGLKSQVHVRRSGWAVVGLSAVVSLALAMPA